MEESQQDHEPTSGFTANLDREMNASSSISSENTYSNLHEYYVSASGHTRLFYATRYGKRYILKCLKEDYLYIPIYQQALVKEFEIGLQLEHPNICHTIAMETLPNLGATIVMEYIDGDSLQTLIEKKLLTRELAHKIISQLIEALEYMHHKQIIHRDLKPSNIMVTHSGRNVKLIDFGLSDSDTFHILKLPAGTKGYIAPEQFLPGAIAEPRTDIYSLGMVISDMAKATADKDMDKLAKICAMRDISHRPSSMEELLKRLSENAHDKHIVWLLSLVILALAACIAITYCLRHSSFQEDKSQQEIQGDSLPQTGNKVMEYQRWDSHF